MVDGHERLAEVVRTEGGRVLDRVVGRGGLHQADEERRLAEVERGGLLREVGARICKQVVYGLV